MLPPVTPGPVLTADQAQPATMLPAPRPRLGDAVLVGLAAAGIGGLLWWALATVTGLDAWPALSAILGLVVGGGVRIGARRGGGGPALLAFVLAALAVPVVVYFIDRTLLIQALDDVGALRTVPLWSGVEGFVDATAELIEAGPTRAVALAVGPVVAAVVAGFGTRP
jgi:hypothetical protein